MHDAAGRTVPGCTWLSPLRAIVGPLLVVFAVLVPRTSLAAPGETWAVLPFNAEGVDPNVASTFRELLQTDLAPLTQAQFVVAPYACADPVCAHAASAKLNAHVVVFGTLRPLGSKILVTASAVDGHTGQVVASSTLTVDRVEDLDVGAKKVAESLVARGPAAASASAAASAPAAASASAPAPAAPPAAAVEAPPGGPPSHIGGSFRVGGIVPLQSTYAGLGIGMALDLGMWLEASYFAIEPRIGVRFDLASDERGSFLEVPLDVGAYFVPLTGDVTPIVGGGVGMHYLSEMRRHPVQVGQTLYTEHSGKFEDSKWGFAAHGRVGVLFFRPHRVRLLISGDYNATFVELNGGKTAQAFVFGVSVIF
jgi:hypothetical protein